jgi:hypothetical protein
MTLRLNGSRLIGDLRKPSTGVGHGDGMQPVR